MKIPNDLLVHAGLKLMSDIGKPLTKLPTKGRAMLYRMDNKETVRIRTCNDHILIAVADTPEAGAKLNIEGTDWLLVIMPEVARTAGNVVAYLIPTKVAVDEVRGTHKEWLETNPKTRGANTTWNLWFDDAGPDKARGYAKKWEKYRLQGEPETISPPAQLDEPTTNTVKAEVNAAKLRIAKAAGVPPEAVRISIDFQS